jgi:WD40 repeat protein
MTDETRLAELLSLWEEGLARGQDLAAAELGRDCPQLVPELERRIEAVRRLDQLAHSTVRGESGPPPNDTRPTVNATPARGQAGAPAAVPGYEILRELGRGGMGVVYLARHLRLGRLVALKRIRAADLAGQQYLQRFLIEAAAVAQLQHPNIVQLYESGEHDGLPYFTLEYVAGGTLGHKVREQPLPPLEAAALVEQLARGVAYAHARGIVHRDLKPDNVLLAEDGTPKIADFGLAKRLPTESGGRPAQEALTHTGAVMGTPSYMAPEQARGGSKDVGPAADVYALGAILYRLLTGRPPFQAPTVMDSLWQVLETDPVAPAQLNLKVPRDLETICLKCLRKEPEKRYAGALALAEDLRRFRQGEPILAKPPGTVTRVVKWARRKPALATLLGVAALATAALLLGGAVFTWQLDAEREHALGQEALARRSAAEAETERDRAQRERSLAVKAQLQAEEQRLRAEQGETEAKRQLTFAQAARYAGQIQYARRLLQDHNLGQALHVLGDCQPDLRHFEHRYLASLCERQLRVLPGHQDTISAVAFLGSQADAPIVVSAGADHTVRLWDLVGDREMAALHGHTTPVLCLACDGPRWRIVSGSQDGKLLFWDARTGQVVLTLFAHAGGTSAVALDRAGQQLASGGADGKVRLWDAKTGKPLLNWKGHGRVFSVAFLPDGKRLLTGGDDGVKLWDTATGTEALPLPQHKANAGSVTVSPDGLHLAAAFGDWKIKVWDALTGKLEHAIEDGNWIINAVAFSPSSARLAAGLANGPVKLYDVKSGQFVSRYDGEKLRGPRCLAYSPDGRWLVTASPAPGPAVGKQQPAELRVWNLQEAQLTEVSFLYGPKAGSADPVVFRPDGRLLAWAGSSGTIVLQDPAGPVVRTLEGHKGLIQGLAFRPDGRQLASAGWDGTVRLWDVETGAALHTLNAHAGGALGVAFHPDGSLLATGGKDNTVKLWNPATGEPVRTLTGHGGWVWAVAFTRDGRTLVSASADKTVKLWDVADGQLRRTLTEHRLGVTSLAFSPDGKLLASGGADQVVHLWDAGTWSEVRSLTGHTEGIGALAFSPDGQRLVSGSGGFVQAGEIKFWDVATGLELLGLRGINYQIVHGLAFARDGELLAVGAGHPFVQLLDVRPAPPTLRLPQYRQAAAACERAQGWLAAAYHLGRVADLDTSSNLAAWQLGDLLQRRKDPAGAVAAYRKALATGPAAAPLYYNLGNAQRDHKDLPGAIASYQQAIALDPTFAQAYCNLGHVLRRQGEFAAALEAMTAGHLLGSPQAGWPYASDQWVEQLQRLVNLRASKQSRPLTAEAAREGVHDRLEATDPLDVALSTFRSFRKTYQVQLQAGRHYLIDLGGDFDTLLRVEDDNFLTLAVNDDVTPPAVLDSRLVFTPARDGVYHLVATSFKPGVTGDFTLRVREVDSVGKDLVLRGTLQLNDVAVGGKYRKAYKVDLAAWRPYVLAVEAGALDGVLLLVDPKGQKVLAQSAKAGDGDGGPRIDFTPAETAGYQVVVTTAGAGQTGAFALHVFGYEPGPAPRERRAGSAGQAFCAARPTARAPILP